MIDIISNIIIVLMIYFDVIKNLLVGLLQPLYLIHGLGGLLKSFLLRIELDIELKDLSLMVLNLLLQTFNLLSKRRNTLLKLRMTIDDGIHAKGGLQTSQTC